VMGRILRLEVRRPACEVESPLPGAVSVHSRSSRAGRNARRPPDGPGLSHIINQLIE
jgi:hypothetical protein